MDAMTLGANGESLVWLLLLVVLVLVDVSARRGAFWLQGSFGDGPDRPSFRYRRRD